MSIEHRTGVRRRHAAPRRPTARAMARLALLGLALAAAAPVSGLEFTPTGFEWKTWPDYCRARYTVSGAGVGSKYQRMVSPAQVEDWSRRLAPVWRGLHHYCAGVVLFERARRDSNERTRKHVMNRVVSEVTYTLDRSEASHPMYAKMLALRGRALYEIEEYQSAFDNFKDAVALHPEVGDPYAAWALLLRRMDKRPQAREVLEKGIEHGGERNAELRYLLGLILTELKEYDAALEHAKAAYELGYPLPGLKRKLIAAGHWEN